MTSTPMWENTDLEGATATSNGDRRKAASRSKINSLKELAFQLMRELQSIKEVSAPFVENGLDFYDEVRRFEIDLIRRALLQTGGHQGRAAKLLHLKVTTLNSKIKHYNISMAASINGYPMVEADKSETRPHP